MCATAARGRGRERRAAEQRGARAQGTGQRERQGQRDRVVKLSIADGTALRCGRGGSRHFRRHRGFIPRGLFVYVATRHRLPTHPRCLPFADTILVRVTKPRFGSKYSGVLRSPHKLKFAGSPIGSEARDKNEDTMMRESVKM